MVLIAALVIGGCGKKSADKDKPEDEKKDEIPATTVHTSAGSATISNEKLQPVWFVKWKNGQIDLTKTKTLTHENGKPKESEGVGPTHGALEGVDGQFFVNGKPNSTFRSEDGSGDKDRQVLTLWNNVHVISSDPKGELTCDKLIYDAAKKRIQALGHVRVVGKVGTVGTLSEVWATPDLKTIATPELFNSK